MEPLSGIYALCHHPTGAVYITRALHIQRRWQEHVDALTRGRHRNGALQAAVARSGLPALGLVILERVDLLDTTAAKRAQRLRFWLGTSEREWCARARAVGIVLYNDRGERGGSRQPMTPTRVMPCRCARAPRRAGYP